MFKDKILRKGIIAGIIAAFVFSIIIQPLIKLFWNFLNKTSIKIYVRFTDSLYNNAALGQRDHIDLINFTGIWIVTIMILVMISITIIFYFEKIIKNNEISNIKDPKERDKLLKAKEEEKRSEIMLLQKNIKVYRILFICFFIATIIAFSLKVFKLSVDYALNTSFNQRLNALAPYVDDMQSEELISKWALMKTKKDYLEIKNIMEDIAKKNNIELPTEVIIKRNLIFFRFS